MGSKKYELMQRETEFLGLMVGTQGFRIGDERKELIRDWPIPTSMTELRSFLALIHFFRWFVKDLSRITAPLTNLTRNNSNISQPNDTCTSSFNVPKESLMTSPIIQAADLSRPFRCHTNAS